MNNRLTSHSSGGWKSEIKAQADSVFAENDLLVHGQPSVTVSSLAVGQGPLCSLCCKGTDPVTGKNQIRLHVGSVSCTLPLFSAVFVH